MADVDLDDLRALALRVAGLAVDVMHSTPMGEIRTKRHAADPVTDIDVATERVVRQAISDAYPDHHVVGEELGGEAWDGPTWYCDPVDGTTNLATGLPWTSFSLSCAIGHEPLVGVVADPWRREVLHVATGGGAYRRAVRGTDDVAVAVSGVDRLTGHVVMTEWAADAAWPGMLDLLVALGERHCTSRVMGSGTLTVASVGAGRAAAAVINQFHPEDHLAALLLCREAGAVVCDRDGVETLWPDRGPFVAAAPAVVAEVLSLLP